MVNARTLTGRELLGGMASLAVLVAAVMFFRTANPFGVPALKSADETRTLPIVMYHSLLRDSKREGDYVLSPEALEKDIAWLSENGYTAVFMSDIISFVTGEGELPEKPVVITLDDGYLNNALYLPEILEKYQFCATVAVVGEFTEIYTKTHDPNPNYGYMTWDDVRALSQTGFIEIANHSYFAHTRVPKSAQSRKSYGSTMAEDAATMQRALEEKAGVLAEVYAYPYGYEIKGADAMLEEIGIKATLGCREGINTIIRGHAECLYSLKRYNRPAGISTEQFMEKMLY